MRLAALTCSALLLLAACGQDTDTSSLGEASPIEPIAVAAADQLTGLGAPATGIAFWTHPNVAFNSLMIIAGADGVASFNIEDGNEVSRIPGVNAEGAAISYIGFGPLARGLLAYFDADAGAMKIHEIDNAVRSFKPVTGDIPIRGAVRGFCFGRAADAEGPTLVVLKRGELTRYAFRLENATLTAKASVSETAPDDIISCAIDSEDGAVFIARENGAVHRIGADGQGALFAKADAEQPGHLAVLLSEVMTDETSSVSGQVILLDKSNGAIHSFNRDDGAPLGAVSIGEAFEIEAVNSADVMGVASANLGALYRNGAIALGLTGADGAGAIRLIPANGLINALGITDGTPLSPRGAIPESDDDGLLIRTNVRPE
ncbi:MAG: hypothetical protein AAF936_12920 [Pseudomonadota bacterium]